MDRQSEAFRQAGPDDWAPDLEPNTAGAGRVLTPEEWDDLAWDHGREEPKSLDDAREALAARVADPAAPDDDASAYDELED